MNFRNQFLSVTCIFLIVATLIGCGSSGDSENISNGTDDLLVKPLSLVGSPPTKLYYDSEFEYIFGAEGGAGSYQYRYIQNPGSETELEEGFTENHLDMEIEIISQFPALFALRVTPALPEGTTFETIEPRNLSFQLEVSDGINSSTRSYQFRLMKNKISMKNAIKQFNEGLVDEEAAIYLENQRRNGDLSVCDYSGAPIVEAQLPSGDFVYPVSFLVELEAPVSKATSIDYIFETDYQDDLAENDINNLGKARVDSDFYSTYKRITFNKGEKSCIAVLDLFDDSIIEPDENLIMVISNAAGPVLDLAEQSFVFSITDDD